MLTGQAKKDYQREYMRRYRSNKQARSNVRPAVRPALDPDKDYVEPIRAGIQVDADGNVIPDI